MDRIPEHRIRFKPQARLNPGGDPIPLQAEWERKSIAFMDDFMAELKELFTCIAIVITRDKK
jgi:hypothetical protein